MSRFKRYQTDKNIDHTRLVSALDFWGGGVSEDFQDGNLTDLLKYDWIHEIFVILKRNPTCPLVWIKMWLWVTRVQIKTSSVNISTATTAKRENGFKIPKPSRPFFFSLGDPVWHQNHSQLVHMLHMEDSDEDSWSNQHPAGLWLLLKQESKSKIHPVIF